MNPENDGTAIWLEKKFDVPSSGAWVTQTVFSIPAAAASTSATTIDGSPGLVVFECTPLDAIDDELERYVFV
jgi:nuclear mRNA export protein SAC3